MKASHLLLLALPLSAWCSAPAAAQVTINITPPAWGPPAPATAQYYYIPDVDAYYDLRARRYLVFRGGRWIPEATLVGYNPAAFHPVVIDYVGATPWVLVREHRVKYPRPKVVRVVQPAPRVVAMPPGQAKKLAGGHPGEGHGHGHGKSHGKGH